MRQFRISLVVAAAAASVSACANRDADQSPFAYVVSLTPPSLYTDMSSDALAGARGGVRRGNTVQDASHRNPCFAKSDGGIPAGTFLALCRQARATPGDGVKAKAYLKSGLNLSDKICRHYLGRFALRETAFSANADVLTLGGATVNTLMAIGQSSQAALGTGSAVLGFLSGASGVARNRLSLAASTDAVYKLVTDERAKERDKILAKTITDFHDAEGLLDAYHESCSYPAIRQSINTAVAEGGEDDDDDDAPETPAEPDPAVLKSLAAAAGVTADAPTLDQVAALYALGSIRMNPAEVPAGIKVHLLALGANGNTEPVIGTGANAPTVSQELTKENSARRMALINAVAASPLAQSVRKRALELALEEPATASPEG